MKSNCIIHIYTTHKNFDRCELILQTWGKHVEDLYFYTDKEYDDKRFIHCTNDDSYESHMVKNFYAIKYAKDFLSDIDWHLFIGDDNFIYNYNLQSLVTQLDKNQNVIIGDFLAPGVGRPDLGYIGGGGGLLMNLKSISAIIDNDKYTDEEKNNYKYSDVVVGFLCKHNNVTMIHHPGFHTHPPQVYGISNPEDHISFHYINTKEQFTYLYDKYQIK